MKCSTEPESVMLKLSETQSKGTNKETVKTQNNGYADLMELEEIYTLRIVNAKLMKENIKLKKLLGLIKDECQKTIEFTR